MGGLHNARSMAADTKRPLSFAGRAAKRRRVSTGRQNDTVVDSVAVAVSTGRFALAHECPVCQGLQRNGADGTPGEHCTVVRPDGLFMVLGNCYRHVL